jgi:hypothetical protein
MHFKKQALQCRQNPLQKAISYGENALKVVGTVKGVYDFGKEAYGLGQSIYSTVAPIAEAAALML